MRRHNSLNTVRDTQGAVIQIGKVRRTENGIDPLHAKANIRDQRRAKTDRISDGSVRILVVLYGGTHAKPGPSG